MKIPLDTQRSNSLPILKRFYVCFATYKQDFLDGCRPIIVLDAYYLKGSCLGELIAAIEIDKNDGMYPIAWAIMEAESKDS